MPDDLAAYIAAGAAILLVAALALRAWLRRRPSPEELERRRRLAISKVGKTADGTVIDVLETLIEYRYDVRGVEYNASQDVTALEAHMPPDRFTLAGPVSVKYDPRNPANSIVLCEEWSGLRAFSAPPGNTLSRKG